MTHKLKCGSLSGTPSEGRFRPRSLDLFAHDPKKTWYSSPLAKKGYIDD